MCVYVYVCVYVCVRARVSSLPHVCTHVHTQIHTLTPVRTHTNTDAHALTDKRTLTDKHTAVGRSLMDMLVPNRALSISRPHQTFTATSYSPEGMRGAFHSQACVVLTPRMQTELMECNLFEVIGCMSESKIVTYLEWLGACLEARQ